jgi:hypothetical protein
VTTPAKTTTQTGTGTGTTTSKQKTSSGNNGKTGGTPQPEALVLDTDAASTYNPYSYAPTGFGDPSLAIDGDTSTGWTAQVEPTTAPHMAVGLLIDLKSPQKLGSVKLITTTPGISAQLYGSKAATAPTSITDPAWVPLSHSIVIRKRHAKLTLRNHKQAYRFLVLWISKAPAASVGTAEKPGRVTVNELELFPPA